MRIQNNLDGDCLRDSSAVKRERVYGDVNMVSPAHICCQRLDLFMFRRDLNGAGEWNILM